MEAPPNAKMLDLVFGHIGPRCLHVVAELGIADALDREPRSASALAAATNSNPDAIDRILRVLASHGVFEHSDNGYIHTPLSSLLRSDHPQSMRAFARMIGGSWCWDSFGAMAHSARTGAPAIETLIPGGIWGHFEAFPADGVIFNEAMTAKSHGDIAAVLEAYDFSGFGSIADIGGGAGHYLRAILDSAPNATGVLFDQPHVLAQAAGVESERLKLCPGDFFKDDLPACDAYILSNILHDWADEEARSILKGVHRSAPHGARVLVIEMTVPDVPGPHLSKELDMVMLTCLGGRERTRAEYETLLSDSGFRLERVVPTRSPYSVIEAAPIGEVA